MNQGHEKGEELKANPFQDEVQAGRARAACAMDGSGSSSSACAKNGTSDCKSEKLMARGGRGGQGDAYPRTNRRMAAC
jgi:hypothetical protein